MSSEAGPDSSTARACLSTWTTVVNVGGESVEKRTIRVGEVEYEIVVRAPRPSLEIHINGVRLPSHIWPEEWDYMKDDDHMLRHFFESYLSAADHRTDDHVHEH
jgi:hypothetical protein